MDRTRLLAVLVTGLFASALIADSGHKESGNGDHHEHAEEPHHAEDDKDGHDAMPQHFEGKPAKDLAQALTNFREANQKLETLLAKDELSSADMNQVHKISYTMENAIARMETEMGTMAEDLEWLHKASERLDEQTVRAKGSAYLDTAQQFAD